MTPELLHAQTLLGALVHEWAAVDEERLDAPVAVADLITAVSLLDQARWGYLVAITGLDLGAETDRMEILYHFCAGASVLTLRVPIPRDGGRVPSLCAIIPYASPFERELAEMFGVTVEGTPDPSHLFLPDNWETGVYPLRKGEKLP